MCAVFYLYIFDTPVVDMGGDWVLFRLKTRKLINTHTAIDGDPSQNIAEI